LRPTQVDGLGFQPPPQDLNGLAGQYRDEQMFLSELLEVRIILANSEDFFRKNTRSQIMMLEIMWQLR